MTDGTSGGIAQPLSEVVFTRMAPPPAVEDSTSELLSKVRFIERGRPLNAHLILSNHPPALAAMNHFLDWGGDEALSSREQRSLILRTSANTACTHEFNVHRQKGVAVGDVTEVEVGLLAEPGPLDPGAFTEREAALLMIADAICATDTLSDQEWTDATAVLNAQEIIESLVVIGYYRMACGLMNALGTPDEGRVV